MKRADTASRPLSANWGKAALVISSVLLASCNAKAQDDRLLASDLVYFKQSGGWTKTITIDPWLSPRPDLVRHIRAERVKTMEEGGWNCEADWGCEEISTFTVKHNGELLVSLVEEQMSDGGGAHPTTGVADYLYDLHAGTRIRFGDLFSSWNDAKPLLQKAFCDGIRENYPEAEECPDVRQQAITLFSLPLTGKVTAFMVDTQDYALGYYAAGRAQVRIDLTPQVISLLKPEYQGEFQVG